MGNNLDSLTKLYFQSKNYVKDYHDKSGAKPDDFNHGQISEKDSFYESLGKYDEGLAHLDEIKYLALRAKELGLEKQEQEITQVVKETEGKLRLSRNPIADSMGGLESIMYSLASSIPSDYLEANGDRIAKELKKEEDQAYKEYCQKKEAENTLPETRETKLEGMLKGIRMGISEGVTFDFNPGLPLVASLVGACFLGPAALAGLLIFPVGLGIAGGIKGFNDPNEIFKMESKAD